MAAMQQVPSAITGTTPTGRPRRPGSSCCSTEAKYELKSMNRLRSSMAWFPPPRDVAAFRHSLDPAALRYRDARAKKNPAEGGDSSEWRPGEGWNMQGLT